MQKLMISLDKKILDKNSRVAMRMISYGEKDNLFIIIPGDKEQAFNLSDTVKVFSTGGGKLKQFFKLKKLGKKIIKENNIDLITTQDPFYIGKIGWLLKRKFKINLEVQLHGDFFGSDYYKKKNFLKYLLGKFIIKKADKLRVVGERIKQSLVKSGISKDKIEVQQVEKNVVRDGIFKIVDLKEDYPQFKKHFIFIGRLEPVKNISWLVQIFSKVLKTYPGYALFIVGDGSQKKQLEKEVQNLGVEKNIIFTGWVENPIPSLKTVDALLLPSLSEGYGLVVVEADAVETAIIMNDVGVANYELKPSEKVKILPINDKEAWIQAILNV